MNINKEYRICNRCVMDTTATEIYFDENGFCNFCSDFLAKIQKHDNKLTFNIDGLLKKIKNDGKGKQYDCIIGVSGGVDSSYVLYLAVKLGLRPLAVHLDNGWNSELAVHNISTLVNSLGVDLHTHVIDWEENRDLQLSFFKSNVIDIEMLMDNAMLKLNYMMAKKYGLHYILSGSNSATEGMAMPSTWNHLKFDKKNIISIHKKFGKLKIRTHPLISIRQYILYEYLYKIKWVSFLDYFEYNKNDALDILIKEVGYKPYPYKHYESVFTRFYQAYILPKKFGIDKRKLHLSTLIISKQMSRENALDLLKKSPYPDNTLESADYEFILKKMGFSKNEFDKYISEKPVRHEIYGSEKWLWVLLKRVYNKFGKKI